VLIPTLLLVSLVSYLLGAVSFSRLIARILNPGADLQNIEMPVQGTDQTYTVTSMGGNTLSMKHGGGAGCLASMLDGLKVFVPTLIVRLLFPDQFYFLAAAIAGFVGHCWPIYYRFKGGRGISAYYGGLFAFDPIGAVVVAFTSLIFGITVFRNVKVVNIMLIYTGGVIFIIPWMWFTTHNPFFLLYAVSINVLFFLAMLPDIRQMVQIIRKYGWKNVDMSMDQFAMGKSMSKMMDRLSSMRKPPRGEP
jgi:glycerol-3-phosphate acyltransferase PlsY